MRGPDWTDDENDVIVAAYFDLLQAQSAGETRSKTEVRLRTLPHLNQRSKGSYERKMSNISAVMSRFGLPWVRGYKPLPNIQESIADAVERYVGRRDVPVPIQVPPDTAPPPAAERVAPPPPIETPRPNRKALVRRALDFAARESQNRVRGLAGELLVLELEKQGLRQKGHDDLAELVVHVSVAEGDGAGYDIRSFDERGAPRLIEVKTTVGGEGAPFLMTANELAVAEQEGVRYELHRVFDWDERPRFYVLTGPEIVTRAKVPTEYRIYPNRRAS